MWMENKHMEWCSTSFAIREMWITITVRYDYTSLECLKLKKTDDAKHCWGCRGTEIIIHCWYNHFGKQFLKKLNINLKYDPAISLLVEWKHVYAKTWMGMFRAALSVIALDWKQSKGPLTGEWINKVWYIHIIEYFLEIKENKLLIYMKISVNLKILHWVKDTRL